MYKAAVRWMIRRNIASLNAGDHRPALAMFSDDIEFSFPGDNSWADEFRPVRRGREVHVTHRGKAEMERFLQRYVAAGLQMEVEDILVNGPPWNLRAAVRVHDFAPSEVGRPLQQPSGPVRHLEVGEAAHTGGLRGHPAGRGLRRPARRPCCGLRTDRRADVTSWAVQMKPGWAKAGCG